MISFQKLINVSTGKLIRCTSHRYFNCGSNFQSSGCSGPPDTRMSRSLPIQTHIPGVKHVVLIGSAKGGVGKSTVSVNTALALKAASPRTNIGLLDVDVFGPSLPTLMDLHGRPKLSKEKLMIPHEKYGIHCMSMGFLIDEGAPIVWRGMMLMQAVQQLLKKVYWDDVDILLVDLPPGTGDVPLSVIQNIPVSGSLIVTTPNKLSLVDVHRGLNMFRKLNVPVFGVVENMSYHSCSNCGHRSELFGKSQTDDFLMKIGASKIGEIPMDSEICVGADIGLPVMIQHPHSASAQSFMGLAVRLAEKLNEVGRVRKSDVRQG